MSQLYHSILNFIPPKNAKIHNLKICWVIQAILFYFIYLFLSIFFVIVTLFPLIVTFVYEIVTQHPVIVT